MAVIFNRYAGFQPTCQLSCLYHLLLFILLTPPAYLPPTLQPITRFPCSHSSPIGVPSACCLAHFGCSSFLTPACQPATLFCLFPPVSRIRDPVPFWPLDPGSGMGFFRIPDLGSQDHILQSFLTIFLVKSSIILWKLAQIFFFITSKLK